MKPAHATRNDSREMYAKPPGMNYRFSTYQPLVLEINSTDELGSDSCLTNVLQRLALNITSLIYYTKWI